MRYRMNLRCAVNLRLSASDMAYLAERAKAQGLSISEYLRLMIQRERIEKGGY